MGNKFMQYVVGAALLSVSSFALAQSSCTSALSSYQAFVNAGNTSGAQGVVTNHPQCFGGSASSQATMNATTVAQTVAISNTLSNRLLSSGGPTTVASRGLFGMAAGGSIDKWNVWGNVTDNTTKLNYTNTNSLNTTSKNDILTSIVGADYAISPTMVVGLSGSFDTGTGNATTGANAQDSISSSGYLFAPYFGMQLTKNLAMDTSVGFGNGKLGVGNGPQSEASRRFGAANLTYSQWYQSLQLTGKLGYLHSEENYGDSKSDGVTNANTKNKNTLDQFRIGAQAGYWINGFMPYTGIAYTTDNRSTSNSALAVDPVGKGAFIWSLGVNYFSLANKITGGIAYNQESNRTNSKNSNLMANINIRF
ncbi:MAG: hypothetical protein WCL27_16500 [Betaproteobacteria bacterium]